MSLCKYFQTLANLDMKYIFRKYSEKTKIFFILTSEIFFSEDIMLTILSNDLSMHEFTFVDANLH